MAIKQLFTQFYANVNGQHVEVSDDSNINQCMDLAYLWTFSLGFPKATIQRLYAKEVYTKATDLTRQYFDVVPNSPTGVPPAGALVVFDATSGNIAGHISIASGVGDTNTFQSFDQNFSPGQRATLVTHNYNTPKVLGWLVPKLSPTYTEAEMTSVRLERDRNWNLYQDQIKKTQEADKAGYDRGFKDGVASVVPTPVDPYTPPVVPGRTENGLNIHVPQPDGTIFVWNYKR